MFASLSAFLSSISIWQVGDISLLSPEHARSMIGFAAFGFMLVVLSATGYRNGDKWAWYPFWVLPVAALGVAALAASDGTWGDVAIYSFVALVAVAGLLLPFRRFFPKRQSEPGR